MNRLIFSKYIIALFDFILFFMSFFFSLSILYFWSGDISIYLPLNQFEDRAFIHLFLSVCCIGWFWIRLRHYTYRKPFWFELKETIRTIIIFSVIELSIVAFSKLYLSRYMWVMMLVISLCIVPVGRILIKKFLIKSGWYLKNTIIIGGRENAIDAYNALMSESYLGLKVKYFISPNKNSDIDSLNIPVICSERNSIWELVTKRSDQFIIALEEDENEQRDSWLRILSKKNYRSVSVIPTLRGLPLYSTDMSFLFSYEVMLLRVNNNLAKRSSRFLKRAMDILGSLCLLILTSPILILLSLLIKMDGGTIIYGHPRIGKDGKAFKCLKLRTMIMDAEEVLLQLLEQDPEARKEWEEDFKLKNDPRVTKVGIFIRKMSLDELPQLFNVLIGQMSLVGPRPIVTDELSYYKEDVDYYLMAKPGMTGLWQVSGRSDIDYKTRVYFDSWYVKNWSLWNDIAILFKTIRVVIKRSGAY